MPKTIETTIDAFNGGIVNDKRDPREATSIMLTNFDMVTSPTKLTPKRSTEDGDSSAADNQIQNFAIVDAKLFGLGVVSSASAFSAVRYKDINVGGTTDLGDALWTEQGVTAKHQATSGTMKPILFTYYKRTGMIYGASDVALTGYDTTGTADYDEDIVATEGGTVGTYAEPTADGLVHSKDDILYVAMGNKIVKNDNGTWSVGITLPTHFTITSISEYGNYLAIGCQNSTPYENSIVYFWDRDSSLATLSETIDAGDGQLKILHQVDGELIAISIKDGFASFKDKIVFRRIGNVATKFLELEGTNNTSVLPIMKQLINNRLFFQMETVINGETRAGVWSIGRPRPGAELALTNDVPVNGDTEFSGANDGMQGFHIVGDYTFISSQVNSVWQMKKTSDTSTAYSQKSIYESKIFETVNPSLQKSLLGATVSTEYLPADGQVVLQYATDQTIGTNSWTTILTNTTDNSISGSVVTGLPKQYKQIQFRIESTGFAEITGLTFKETVTGKRLYE